jgi:hypothetical protein
MRLIARVLSLLWAAFWVWFGIASGIGEGLTAAGTFVHTAAPGLIFLGSALLAWRVELVGGIGLIAEGLLVCVAYPVVASGRFPPQTVFFVVLTMGAPALIAGVLFLASWRGSRRAHFEI